MFVFDASSELAEVGHARLLDWAIQAAEAACPSADGSELKTPNVAFAFFHDLRVTSHDESVSLPDTAFAGLDAAACRSGLSVQLLSYHKISPVPAGVEWVSADAHLKFEVCARPAC